MRCRQLAAVCRSSRGYSRIQGRLCAALFEKHGVAEDRFLANIPPSGLLTLDNDDGTIPMPIIPAGSRFFG
jgi:hypothetical protein